MRKVLIGLNVLAPIGLVVLGFTGHFWIGLLVLFVTHMLTLIATLVPGCRWWGPVVTRSKSEGLWLTIDDGPDPEDTPAILEMLAERNAQATFFVIGEKAARWPELIEAILNAGHSVENHTLTHPQFKFWRLGPAGVRAEIEGGQKAVAEITGKDSKLFRAPAGMRNCFVHPVLSSLGLRLVGWSVRGRDGVSTDRNAIVQRLLAGMEPGAILLMHEGMRDAEGLSVIADTLPLVLAGAEERGLSFCLPELSDSAVRLT